MWMVGMLCATWVAQRNLGPGLKGSVYKDGGRFFQQSKGGVPEPITPEQFHEVRRWERRGRVVFGVGFAFHVCGVLRAIYVEDPWESDSTDSRGRKRGNSGPPPPQ